MTTPEFNVLAADVFNSRLAQANLITKTDFDAKLSSLNRKIVKNYLIRAISLAKVILKKTVHKII